MPGLRADASNQNCDVPPEVFADISSRMGAGPFVASNNVRVAQIAGALAMAFNWAASDGHWRIHKRATIRPAGVAIMPPMPHRMCPSSISRALCPAPICCVGVNPFATISRSDFHSGTVSSSAEGMRIIFHAFDLRPPSFKERRYCFEKLLRARAQAILPEIVGCLRFARRRALPEDAQYCRAKPSQPAAAPQSFAW